MSDPTRRSVLGERSRTLRERANAFYGRLKDERVKEFVRTTVFHKLDDVDQFFLGEPNTRPSMEMWEQMWLDNAELVLSTAERSFSMFEAQVSRYGGPENVRMFD